MSGPFAEWLAKADADRSAARALMRQRKHPLYDQVCFLCQQSVEKYLKAFLTRREVRFPKTHNLLQLNDMCADLDQGFAALGPDLGRLDAYAVEIRYPGESATNEDARTALAIATSVQRFVGGRLRRLATIDLL